MDLTQRLAREYELKAAHVQNIIDLIDGGNTIPFIARYRKEMTGACDDQVLRTLDERLKYLRHLNQRREEIIASITQQEKMSPELHQNLQEAQTLARLEDLYRPYKPKRRTRGSVARERGLEPLSRLLLAQELQEGDLSDLATPFVDDAKEVPDVQSALSGAQDIIAEDISDDPQIREELRELYWRMGRLVVQGGSEESTVYEMYYDYEEALAKIPSHRVLAVNRGEKEGVLKVQVEVDSALALQSLFRRYLQGPSLTTPLVEAALADGYDRLLSPSLARECRSELTEKAQGSALENFRINLEALLLQPPVKGKVVLGFDPAYRTGCKLAVVDATGKALQTAVIYPTPPQKKVFEAKAVMRDLIEYHKVELIAIGNGTASQESELFVAELIQELKRPLAYMVVNEAGASVYSASPLAAKEFPDYDVSLRSAVSIARRLQDPLAELVKIDPKALGVGQYQHDMPEKRLDESLSGVVEDCVNRVGVDLNTASAPLLTYVAGLTPAVAQNIIRIREEEGPFENRKRLLKVPKLGPKTFEQCAGFLRIPQAADILDNTGVHPESYEAAKKLLTLFGYTVLDVREKRLTQLPHQVTASGEAEVAQKCGIGVPTLQDIVRELIQPGRDWRETLPPPLLRTDVMTIEDLKPEMVLEGTVRNVIDFGVFVDLGVHQDGLVHISEVCHRFIKHPSEVLRIGQVVKVKVLAVDVPKKRISLSMKALEARPAERRG